MIEDLFYKIVFVGSLILILMGIFLAVKQTILLLFKGAEKAEESVVNLKNNIQEKLHAKENHLIKMSSWADSEWRKGNTVVVRMLDKAISDPKERAFVQSKIREAHINDPLDYSSFDK